MARPYGLTYAPIAFAPAIGKQADFGPLQRVPAGRADRIDCWMPSGPRRELVNLSKVPVIVVSGGASYHAAYDHCTVTFLKWAGVPVEEALLDDRGISGNTHGFPTESNNDVIAKLIASWLADRRL